MADSIEVGNLVVRIIADAKQLETSLAKGSADFRKFGSDADKAGKSVTKSADDMGKALGAVVGRLAGLAAAYVSVTSVIGAFNQAVSNVTQLDHLSQATGVAVERLSELRNIALATGVDFQTVSQAFSQFGARMTEALASSTSRGSQALRALSIDVRDSAGNIRQLDELLPELAQRFSAFANGSNKAALAAAIFGEEAGPKMLALLNRGSAGLEEIRRNLGSTYTAEDAERVRQYQTSVANLQVAFERATAALVARFGPALTAVANAMADTIAPATRSQEAMRAWETQLAAVELMERALAEGRMGRHPLHMKQLQETLEKGRERLEQLRQEMVLAVTPPATPAAGPQAPAMDPFALEKAQIVLDQLMERLNGQRDIFDSINLSWQEHGEVVQRALQQIDRAHDQQHRREAARHRFEMNQRRQEQQAMLDTASMAASVITQLWPKQKGAAIAAAIINTAVGVTKALSSAPPPWNFIQAALVAASGAAQIASIRSTNEDGNGSGTSAPAPAAVEPVVDQGRSLTINGVDPGSLFSGGQVRGLIEMINEEVRNGATLISSGRLAA
jgi:hypothetical protein